MRRLALALLFLAIACTKETKVDTQTMSGKADDEFKRVHDEYVVEFLRRNPVVNTYLGGAGLDPSLKNVDGRLRDHSANALAEEDRWLESMQQKFERIEPESLSPTRRVDREVALAQIRYQLHLHQVRRYQQRSLDTYTDEPFRGIDWQLQGLTQTGEKSYGTAEEWTLVAERAGAVPRYLAVARDQLISGIQAHNTPDHRMLRENGVKTAEANAGYFERTLPQIAAERIAGPQRNDLLKKIRENGAAAARAYLELRDFITATFFSDPNAPDSARAVKNQFGGDRYMLGETEYDWAIKNNLRLKKNAARLFEESWPVVEATRTEMVSLAREIGGQRGWTLPAEGPAAVRYVFDQLGNEYPQNDQEMVEWYRQTCARLVEYGRKSGIFDIPDDYKLDVTITPPPLRASIDGAAYYPAPPFKGTGVGRFYVTPTDNDPAALKEHNRSALADLAAHEGFPGHDWHFKVMTQYKDEIAPIRWLTPGAVEDSSSMWEDSMAMEGWGLYAEALMAEAQPGFLNGFYTPEERLYQLQGKLYRDLRVRVDTGIHTGRTTFDQAVDLFSEIVDFLPGSCKSPQSRQNPAKDASCKSAWRAIFRYSKWPTQAITYRLGKEEIQQLRADAAKQAGEKFSPKEFHVEFMKQGTIPVGYFREELLKP